MKSEQRFLPALRFHALTPLYDWVLRYLMQEQRFKSVLIKEAQILPGYRVLDLGCGTATLTILVKKAHPTAIVTGLDADPSVLTIGRSKAARDGLEIQLEEGMANDLPYPADSFQVVLSSLMFHHLKTQDKQAALNEVYRVLCSNGMVYLLDFGPPEGLWSRSISPLMARLEEVGDHHKGLIPVMMRRSDFQEVAVVHRFATFFGTLYLYVGRKQVHHRKRATVS
jgi:ubiquinone/menaquinone biosynthesis C-methylase UbiE